MNMTAIFQNLLYKLIYLLVIIIYEIKIRI